MFFEDVGFMNKGFTLVELVLVLVVIGLLSAVAVPKYIEVNNVEDTNNRQQISGSVKAAWMVAKADTGKEPTVAKLVSYIQGEQVQATSQGVQLSRDGDVYVVATYKDPNCSDPTHNATDLVGCVGAIAN